MLFDVTLREKLLNQMNLNNANFQKQKDYRNCSITNKEWVKKWKIKKHNNRVTIAVFIQSNTGFSFMIFNPEGTMILSDWIQHFCLFAQGKRSQLGHWILLKCMFLIHYYHHYKNPQKGVLERRLAI